MKKKLFLTLVLGLSALAPASAQAMQLAQAMQQAVGLWRAGELEGLREKVLSEWKEFKNIYEEIKGIVAIYRPLRIPAPKKVEEYFKGEWRKAGVPESIITSIKIVVDSNRDGLASIPFNSTVLLDIKHAHMFECPYYGNGASKYAVPKKKRYAKNRATRAINKNFCKVCSHPNPEMQAEKLGIIGGSLHEVGHIVNAVWDAGGIKTLVGTELRYCIPPMIGLYLMDTVWRVNIEKLGGTGGIQCSIVICCLPIVLHKLYDICVYLPYSRWRERCADTYALQHANDTDILLESQYYKIRSDKGEKIDRKVCGLLASFVFKLMSFPSTHPTDESRAQRFADEFARRCVERDTVTYDEQELVE